MEKQEKHPKNYSLIIFSALVVVGMVLFWPKPIQTLQIDTVSLIVGKEKFQAEVSRTPESRSKGLSFRDKLCFDCAMLFVFDQPGQYGFWMKDMRFPIDILWIRNGKIVHKETNVSEKNPTTLKPDVEADMVLEVRPNSPLQKGDTVILK